MLEIINVNQRLQNMADTAVSHQVLSARPQMFNYDGDGQLAAQRDDCLVHGVPTLHFLAKIVGWDRIMLGSDCPFDMGCQDPVEFVDALGIDEDQRACVFAGNASRFLK